MGEGFLLRKLSPRRRETVERRADPTPNDRRPVEPTRPVPGGRPGQDARHLILLPTLNEEEGLEATLRELDRVPFRGLPNAPAIAVIDGHSTDGTREVARRWGVTVVLQRSKGKGAAMREGLSWAARQGFETVAVLDADGTYAAASLPGVFDLLDRGSELVVGIRRRETSSRRSVRDLIHRFGNGMLNFAAAEFSRHPVIDICSGFWGVQTRVVEALQLESDGFDIESELFVKAFREGLVVSQIPVAYRTRVGAAKLHAARDGIRILLAILRYSLRPRSPNGRPTGRPAGGRPSLNSVLLALDPAHVIFLSAPGRLREADAEARRLTSAAPNVSVATTLLPHDAPSIAGGHLLPGLTDPPNGIGPTVVVELPPVQGPRSESRPVVLGIPRTGRVVRLASSSTAGEPRVDPEAIGDGQFRRERLPGGVLSAFFILTASIEPTWTRRELALLGANAHGYPLSVYRHPPSSPAPPTSHAGGRFVEFLSRARRSAPI